MNSLSPKDSSARPRILWAEDDPVTRELVSGFLSKSGWDCEAVPDGRSALDKFNKQSFDLVLADFQMPELNGLELLRHVRTSNPSQAFVVLTGSGSVGDVLELLYSGASSVVQKPIDFDSLSRVVRQFLEANNRHEKESQLYRFLKSESNHFEFTSAELAQLQASLPLAERLMRRGVIPERIKLQIDLAFSEALSNALDHGNLELDSKLRDEFDAQGLDRFSALKRERLADPHYASRKVTVRAEYSDGQFRVWIRDQGKGFPVASRRKDEIDVSQLHGRGLSLIRGLMTEVQFYSGGTEICLVKRITADR